MGFPFWLDLRAWLALTWLCLCCLSGGGAFSTERSPKEGKKKSVAPHPLFEPSCVVRCPLLLGIARQCCCCLACSSSSSRAVIGPFAPCGSPSAWICLSILRSPPSSLCPHDFPLKTQTAGRTDGRARAHTNGGRSSPPSPHHIALCHNFSSAAQKSCSATARRKRQITHSRTHIHTECDSLSCLPASSSSFFRYSHDSLSFHCRGYFRPVIKSLGRRTRHYTERSGLA